jgi:hypothetical protein
VTLISERDCPKNVTLANVTNVSPITTDDDFVSNPVVINNPDENVATTIVEEGNKCN